MNRMTAKVNRENLRQLCWKRDYHGVSGLARSLGVHRTTVHRAVRAPEKFAITYSRIIKALA